jgi:hypothetical protein
MTLEIFTHWIMLLEQGMWVTVPVTGGGFLPSGGLEP